jgi:hypothetical protein
VTTLAFASLGGLSAPFLFLCRRAEAPIVVARPEPVVERPAPPTTWPRCLWCECEIGDGFFYSFNICSSCFTVLPKDRRKACEAMTERWRKWHRRDCYVREAWFNGPPSPWQLDVYRLAQRIGLGEHSESYDPDIHTEIDSQRRARAEARPDPERACIIQSVREKLGLTRTQVRDVLRGEMALPDEGKGRLLDNVRVWFSTLREAS